MIIQSDLTFSGMTKRYPPESRQAILKDQNLLLQTFVIHTQMVGTSVTMIVLEAVFSLYTDSVKLALYLDTYPPTLAQISSLCKGKHVYIS